MHEENRRSLLSRQSTQCTRERRRDPWLEMTGCWRHLERDRSRAEPTDRGLPDAVQVADRVLDVVETIEMLPRPAQCFDGCFPPVGRTVRRDERLTQTRLDSAEEGIERGLGSAFRGQQHQH